MREKLIIPLSFILSICLLFIFYQNLFSLFGFLGKAEAHIRLGKKYFRIAFGLKKLRIVAVIVTAVLQVAFAINEYFCSKLNYQMSRCPD